MTIRWQKEACELARDPQSGAAITRLTGTLMHNINIYYEQPYGTPDGKRVAYMRSINSDPRLPPGQQLCVADLTTYSIALLDDRVRSYWVATSPWSGHVFYLRDNGELMHVNLTTLEKQVALTHWPLSPDAYLWSVSPDLRYLITQTYDADYHCNIMRCDLQTGEWKQIYRHPFEHSHIQVNHVNGRDILLQRGRGIRRNHLGQRRKEPNHENGATHVVIDIDGGNERQIKIGEPWTGSSTGHASWVAGTGRMATPVAASPIHVGDPDNVPPVKHDARHPEGNFIFVGPDDDEPSVFPAPTHLFNHASVSRCGRYFVADCYCHGLPGATEIVVGDMKTGRHRVLVTSCGAQGGGAACSHPHPYFTADNAHVIYNADPYGICHLHKATLPQDFLQSLA